MAWSTAPVLAVMAPVLMQYYYDNAGPMDSFLAAGGGMGYMFPDFFEPSGLDNYVATAAGLGYEHVWLLNSYTPYETRYSDRVLDTYARHYEGVVLDYGTSPTKQGYWNENGVPFVRSLQWMGDVNDFKAKLAQTVTFRSGTEYIYVTLNPWRGINLTDITTAIDDVCDEYEFVGLGDLFGMIEDTGRTYDYPDDSRRSIAAMPRQWEGIWELVEVWEWIIVLGALTVLAWTSAFGGTGGYAGAGKKARGKLNGGMVPPILCGTATSLFLMQMFGVIYQNYWVWPSLILIPVAAMVYPFLRKRVRYEFPDRPLPAAAILAMSALGTLYLPILVLPGALCFFLLIRHRVRETVMTFPGAISLGIALSFFAWLVWPLIPVALVLVMSGHMLEQQRSPGAGRARTCMDRTEGGFGRLFAGAQRSVGSDAAGIADGTGMLTTMMPAIFLGLAPLPAFYLDMHIVNRMMDHNGYAIVALSLLVPLVAFPPGLRLAGHRRWVSLTFPPTFLLLLVSPSPIVTVVILILLQGQIYALAFGLFFNQRPGSGDAAWDWDFSKNLVAMPVLMGLIAVIPPMIYTIHLISIPYPVLLILYVSPLRYFFLTLLFVGLAVVLERTAARPSQGGG